MGTYRAGNAGEESKNVLLAFQAAAASGEPAREEQGLVAGGGLQTDSVN